MRTIWFEIPDLISIQELSHRKLTDIFKIKDGDQVIDMNPLKIFPNLQAEI